MPLNHAIGDHGAYCPGGMKTYLYYFYTLHCRYKVWSKIIPTKYSLKLYPEDKIAVNVFWNRSTYPNFDC